MASGARFGGLVENLAGQVVLTRSNNAEQLVTQLKNHPTAPSRSGNDLPRDKKRTSAKSSSMQTGFYSSVQFDARDRLAKQRGRKLRPARKLRPMMRESHPNAPGGTVPCAGRAGAPNVVKHEKN